MNRHFLFSLVLLGFISFSLSACIEAAIGLGAASVAASNTEKGLATSVSDGVIEAKLTEKFIQKNVNLATFVEKSVNDGMVLLTGRVETIEDKTLASRLAWEIRGVREVVNEIQITSESNITDRAKDLAAGAQLRATLIADSNISSLNYSIDVVNGIVYLSGVATDDVERQRVVNHARELRFAKKVVNYIILSTDKRD